MTHSEEILAVKELGEKIGYSNLMQTASALWDRDMRRACKQNYFAEGIYVPTNLCFVKRKMRNTIMANHEKEYGLVVNTLDL